MKIYEYLDNTDQLIDCEKINDNSLKIKNNRLPICLSNNINNVQFFASSEKSEENKINLSIYGDDILIDCCELNQTKKFFNIKTKSYKYLTLMIENNKNNANCIINDLNLYEKNLFFWQHH